MKRLAISMMVLCSLMMVSVAAWCGDNGNGTVTVNGQVWLKDAGCMGAMKWDAAMARPKNLAHGQCGLSDNSKPGDWRLPTLDELKAMYAVKSQFKNVQARYYWSSSTIASNTDYAWLVYMFRDEVSRASKNSPFYYVWPVRAVK
jgi:hypothetical protein